MKKQLTQTDMAQAVDVLSQTDRGKASLKSFVRFLDDTYGDPRSLDGEGKRAMTTLVLGALGAFSGSAKEYARQAIRGKGDHTR